MKKFKFIFSVSFCLSLMTSFKSSSQAAFTYTLNPITGCSPVFVQFTDASTGATSWSWDLDNGSTESTLQNPSVTYTTPGIYHVTLTINGGTDSVSHDVIVYASPTASFTASDTIICTHSFVTFTSTSIAGSGTLTKWKWGFGDGFLDTLSGTNVSHQFNTQGTFTVSLEVYNSNGCYAQSQTFNVTTIDGPAASFTYLPAPACTVPVTIIFTNTSTGTNGSTIYSWNFGDATSTTDTASTANAAYTYLAAGTDTVTFIVSNGGCTATFIDYIHAEIFIADVAVDDTVCTWDIVNFTDISTPASIARSWDFGDPASGSNNTSSLANATHFYAQPGTYTVVLHSASTYCSDDSIFTIFVRPQPQIDFVADDSMFCQSTLVTFTPTSVPPIASALWDYQFDSGVDADSIAPYQHTYNDGDTVALYVTDIYGCKDTLIKPDYIQIIFPVAIFTVVPDSGCRIFTRTFDASLSSSPADPIVQYSWNFGDGSPTINTTVDTVTYTWNLLPYDTGIFIISLTVTTADGCTATFTVPEGIKIGYPPVADFSWTPPVLCFGDTLFCTDLSTVAPPAHVTGWYWTFSDGGISLDQNPIHVCIIDTGIFNIELIAYFNGCPDTLKRDSIFIVHPPNPDFIVLPTDCSDPYTVTFVDISKGADSITFDLGDGTHLNNLNQNDTIIHTYILRGNYTITDSAWNFQYGCQWQKEHGITISDPLAIINADDTVLCYPAVINFTASASLDASSYVWDFGDPASGILNNYFYIDTVHVYNLPGWYTVTLSITDVHGCVDVDTQLVHIQGPTAGFTVDNITGCTPLTVNFTDTSHTEGGAIVQYIWDFSYPSTPVSVTTPTISHTFTTPGYYNIYLTVIDANGCRDTTLRPSFIIPTYPAPTWSPDTFVCPGFSSPYSVNPGTIPPNVFDVIWNFGDGTIPDTTHNTANMSHTYTTNNQVYTLTVTVIDSNGCDSTITQNITVLAPVADIVDVTAVSQCGSLQVEVTAADTTGIYSWNYFWTGSGGQQGSSSDVTLPHQTFFYNTPGTYSGYVIVTNPGCSDTSAVNLFGINLATTGTYEIIHDSLCSPDTVTFIVHADSIPSSIRYDFGDGSGLTTTDTIVQHIYYANGSAQFFTNVFLTFDVNGGTSTCTDTAFTPDHFAYLISYLSVNITQDTVIVPEGQQVTLNSVATPPGIYNYFWHVIPSGILLPIVPQTSATYTGEEGDNSVMLTITDNIGCEAYDTVFIIIIPCEKMLELPNVFTPNGDNLNDTYHIDSLCTYPDFRFEIFNRWGNKVYESSDVKFKWDGKNMSGIDCSEGTYYYIMYAKKGTLHGYITLIRKKE